MARTRWPPDPENPGLLPRPGRSDRQRRWVPQNLGPADKSILKTARAASADSEVRPGPRPPTLRPHHSKAREAGPEALTHILPADSLLLDALDPCRRVECLSAGSVARAAPAVGPRARRASH